MSEQSLKISFGKFLERAFHPDPDRKPIGSCPHDYVRNHIRLFIRRNLTIRIHNEETSNFEIFLPTTRPYVRAETKLVLKNQEITASYQKSTAYWDSVAARLNSFSTIEVVDPAKMDKLRLALADLLDRLEDDRRDFLTALADAAKKVGTASSSDEAESRPAQADSSDLSLSAVGCDGCAWGQPRSRTPAQQGKPKVRSFFRELVPLTRAALVPGWFRSSNGTTRSLSSRRRSSRRTKTSAG